VKETTLTFTSKKVLTLWKRRNDSGGGIATINEYLIEGKPYPLEGSVFFKATKYRERAE